MLSMLARRQSRRGVAAILATTAAAVTLHRSNTTFSETRARLVALDMDGTTLTSDRKMTRRTIETIRKVEKTGVRVVIATGRPALALQPYMTELAIPRPMPTVCFNGACAMWVKVLKDGSAENTLIFSVELSTDAAGEVLTLCEKLDWSASLFYPMRTVTNPQSARHVELLARFEDLEGVKQERVGSLRQVLAEGGPLLKVVAPSDDPERDAKKARDHLPPGLVHIIPAECHIEFINPAANKGTSLRRLCNETLGVPLSEVVAFGDNHNDIEMLSMVGEGVAMHNAKAAVQAVAKRVSLLTNNEEAVANELTDMLEKGRLVGSASASPQDE